jgi:hypothetical protein
MNINYILRAVLLILLVSTTSIFAQDAKPESSQKSKEDIEKAAQNPIASMYVLPFQNNTQFGLGKDHNMTQNITNIQPVIPVSLSENVNLIVRTIIPLISQPTSPNESKFGLGDVALSLFFTPRKPGKIIWGVGPAIGMPTATDAVLGTKKWSAGPSIIALVQPKGWTMGFVVQNTWSFAGDDSREEVNSFYTNVFVVKNLKKGWYVNSAPIITANWNAEEGEQWTVPLGIGAGKVFRVGKLPINAQVGYYNYVIAPTNGPDWQLRAQINFMFPK